MAYFHKHNIPIDLNNVDNVSSTQTVGNVSSTQTFNDEVFMDEEIEKELTELDFSALYCPNINFKKGNDRPKPEYNPNTRSKFPKINFRSSFQN